jgi:hypothetical protein
MADAPRMARAFAVKHERAIRATVIAQIVGMVLRK